MDFGRPATPILDQWRRLFFRREIFDYMHEGEELVEQPFQRLIKDDELMAFKHEGFWRRWIR